MGTGDGKGIDRKEILLPTVDYVCNPTVIYTCKDGLTLVKA